MNKQDKTATAHANEKNGEQSNEHPDKLEQLEKEADKVRTRKPGSQSNSSDQKNNGRGGGK